MPLPNWYIPTAALKPLHIIYVSTFQMAELTLNLSESVVLPFDVVNYARFLERDFNKIESRYNELATANGASFSATLYHLYIFPYSH